MVGCFSTALLTASSFYGIPVARVGTELLLDRLAPYQNSNRVPVTIADALLPPLEPGSAPEVDLAGLLPAVGYAMQPELRPDLRDAAERYLAASLDAHTWRYFKRRRLTALGLPGAIPSQLGFIPRNATVRRVARRVRGLCGGGVGGCTGRFPREGAVDQALVTGAWSSVTQSSWFSGHSRLISRGYPVDR